VPTAIAAPVPVDVCIPSGFAELTIDFFDDYPWRTLIALTSAMASSHSTTLGSFP